MKIGIFIPSNILPISFLLCDLHCTSFPNLKTEFSEDELEGETPTEDKEGADFEKIEEPRHSPCEELEKPDSPLDEKPYSPTESVEKVESLDGEPLEDGEIKEEGEEDKKNDGDQPSEVKTSGFFGQLFESFTLYFNNFKVRFSPW